MAGGWKELYRDWSWARGEGHFRIPAYSEYMPPPRIGQKPYGYWDIDTPFTDDDAFGWQVGATEQERELAPGLANIARQVVDCVVALGKGSARVGRMHLVDNPYWPGALARADAGPAHERYLFLSPLALSKSQDDKGRVRWTLFGASHLGPARGFWKSFFTAPGVEKPAKQSEETMRQLLETVYEEHAADLRAAHFRIMPTGPVPNDLADGELPAWTRPFLMEDADDIEGVRYLLTFRPFSLLPEPVQRAYLDGKLHLLPYPGSLIFWGSLQYRELNLPFAGQILLSQVVARHASPRGIRVPQSGWLHHHGEHDLHLGEAKDTYRRTHRWQRMHREDDSTTFACEDHIHKVLFSTQPDDIGLYGKPLARNAQIWSAHFHPVLHGPAADTGALVRAMEVVAHGHSLGYRFFYPPMQAGRFALFWHRPLIAFRHGGKTRTLDNLLTGYLTAEDAAGHSPAKIELWPRFSAEPRNTKPLTDAERSRRAAAAFTEQLGVPADASFDAKDALTFHHTATRPFEVKYWKTIAKLAEGRYLNKNSADCSTDPATQARLPWPKRDLDQLGDFLLDYYRKLARDTGTEAVVGDMPFRWKTDFEFPWMEGWLKNQDGRLQERNIVCVIPGRDRKQAIIMGDHYDTAYMEDTYGYRSGKNDGARMAASGADDNHSATSALMLGAEVFMELSRQGRLARDIWLVHLTGEEFPADCLGARHLAQLLVEGAMRIETMKDTVDLSDVAVKGAYVLDMIAHNNDRRRDIFQIAPGGDRQSLWLAYQAHWAARAWAQGAAVWNASDKRRGLGRGRRSPHGAAIPLTAQHLAPTGEVRFREDPRSTLFNTDGQIFADAGIPTVLFMENYDINREGYHDTLDTMANIDLDYGAAVAAITIEAAARAASEPLGDESRREKVTPISQ